MSNDSDVEQLVETLDQLDPSVMNRALQRLGFVPARGDVGDFDGSDFHSGPSGSGPEQNAHTGVDYLGASKRPARSDKPNGPHQSGLPSARNDNSPPSGSPPIFGSLSNRLALNLPRLSTFSGDGTSKGDVKFSHWKFEVNGLIQAGELECNIMQSIRRSVRGTAAEVIRNMPFTSTSLDIMKKFEGFFGDVLTGETLIQKFYDAKQKPNESVAAWACYLESLLTKAIDTGKISPGVRNDMLFSKFWVDLYDERIKSATRHHYDSNTEFEQLFVVVRTIEQELQGKCDTTDNIDKKTKKPQSHQQTTAATEKAGNDEVTMKAIMTQLRDMSKRMDRMENEFSKRSESQQHSTRNGQNRLAHTHDGKQPTERKRFYDVICYRCGGDGHVALRCRSVNRISPEEVEKIKAYQRQSLNSTKPLLLGKQ